MKKTREELIQEIDNQLREKIPGATFGFTQPIEMRVDELVAGVKADVAVLLYGDEMPVLQKNAKKIEDLLGGIQGAAMSKPTINLIWRRNDPAETGKRWPAMESMPNR